MPDEILPSWVTKEPTYVTLVDHDPDRVVTTILVERIYEARSLNNFHRAVVLTFGEGYISVNGQLLPPTGDGGLETDLCNLADEATSTMVFGHCYYSDPDAS